MMAVCWMVVSTLTLYCGGPQPDEAARDTFAVETGRWDPTLAEFEDISPPSLRQWDDVARAAHERLVRGGR